MVKKFLFLIVSRDLLRTSPQNFPNRQLVNSIRSQPRRKCGNKSSIKNVELAFERKPFSLIKEKGKESLNNDYILSNGMLFKGLVK